MLIKDKLDCKLSIYMIQICITRSSELWFMKVYEKSPSLNSTYENID